MRRRYDKLAKAAASLPDPNVSEDKFAVSDAVRYSHKDAPPEPQINWTTMSNEDFKRLSKQKFGFDSPVE